jgi:hypothetical protein
MRLPDDLTIDSLAPLTTAGSLMISRSELAEPLIRLSSKYIHASERHWSGQWAEGEASGTRWRQLEHNPPTSLEAIFLTYRDAIAQATGASCLPQWMCYPIIVIDSLGCCGNRQIWRVRHKRDLSRLVNRVPKLKLRQDLSVADQSLTQSMSIYYTEGSTTRLSWNFERGRGYFGDHLMTIILVEYVLLGYWQLTLLADRIDMLRRRVRSARQVQEDAIFGLQEYRRSFLVYGTAKDIARRLFALLGGDELYPRLLESIGMLQQLSDAEQAKRSIRTQTWVAVIAVFAAGVLGIPAIQQSLLIVKSLPRKGLVASVFDPLRALSDRGSLGVVEGYLVLLLAVVLVLLASYVPRVRARRMHRRSMPGMRWRS